MFVIDPPNKKISQLAKESELTVGSLFNVLQNLKHVYLVTDTVCRLTHEGIFLNYAGT